MGLCGSSVRNNCQGKCDEDTLGALVTNNNGSYWILGASHVFAVENSGRVGDSITQPACVTGGGVVATLSQFTTSNNTVDAAIAAIVANQVSLSGPIQNIGQISTTPLTCTVNAHVQIMGCTSCHIPGTIASCNKGTIIDSACISGAPFVNQYGVIMSSQNGDSGALVVTQGACPRAVGLLMSGFGGVATVNPISAVLNTFGVSLVGKACTSLTTASENNLLSEEDLQPTQEQLEADDVARTLGPNLLKIPGVWGYESTIDQSGHMFIKVMVDAITPEIEQTVPPTLGGFPVQISQEHREVLLGGDSRCAARIRNTTGRLNK